MKILAIEKESAGVKPEQFNQYLLIEARKVWDLYQDGIIRELYFRKDNSEAILIMECQSADDASDSLKSLPLVKAGLITFEIIPLIPYPGFSRLFADQ